MAILLHKRGGQRVLVAEGCILLESDVNAHYTETFDELVALTKPIGLHDTEEHAARAKRIREGKPMVLPATKAR